MNDLRYEDAAEQVTVTKADGSTMVGWIPKCKSNVIWLEEHIARYSACSDLPCACGRRMDRGWAKCAECRHKMDLAKWDEAYKKATLWDGEEPLCEFDGDRFFWDADDVSEYIFEWFENGNPLEDIKIVHCKPDNGPHFEMSEFLSDSLPEDKELDDREINKTVNAWIKANSPFCYWPDNSRPVLVESFAELWADIKKEATDD